MMKTYRIVALGLAFAMAATAAAVAADGVKSGPQVGKELAGPFHPLNVNGKAAGKKHCLYCENGNAPVAMIFAREPSTQLTALITKLDAACVKNKSCKMASFVVFCSDEAALEGQLKKLATDSDLKKVVLSIDNPAGPKGYDVAKDADVTVVLYTDRTVKANHAFKKGELTSTSVDAIVGDLKKILPE
jgi:hypothetical protein